MLPPSVLDSLEIFVDGEVHSWQIDPQDASVALVDIDIKTPEDFRSVRILATYTQENAGDYNEDYNEDYDNNQELTDYNEDYNNDYSTLYSRSKEIIFDNTFEVYGYDLGNNIFTENRNPEFNIYMVEDRFGDYNADYNWDYAYFWKTYSNFIAYRKPFTNEVYFYDNTSSDIEGMFWKTKDARYETRNGVHCNGDEFELCVTKYLYDEVEEEEDNCQCGDPQTRLEVVEEYLHCGTVPALKPHFGKWSTKAINLDFEDCMPVTIAQNSLNTIIDKPLQTYYIDDELSYPYELEVVQRELYGKDGTLYLDASDSYNLNEEWWTPNEHPFTFTDLPVGDYLVKTTISAINYCGQVLRKCETIDEFYNRHYLMLNRKTCDLYELDNCAFHPATATIYRLDNNDIFQEYRSLEIPALSRLDVEFEEDGVYKLEVDTIPSRKVEIFTFVITCQLEECLKDVIDDIMCNPPCSNGQEDFTQFNLITVVAYTLFQKMHKLEFIQNYYLEQLSELQLADLYEVNRLLNQINLFCYDCEGIKVAECKDCR